MKKIFPHSAFLVLLLIFASCGGGDDDGRRLGDLIVGTWQRGWGEGDVIVEGDTNFEPEDFSYDLFIFKADGSFNGMVRQGTFTAIDEFGDTLHEGDFRCDNNNLKLEYVESGEKRTILAQVLQFSDDIIIIRYTNDEPSVTVTMTLRRYSGDTDADPA